LNGNIIYTRLTSHSNRSE